MTGANERKTAVDCGGSGTSVAGAGIAIGTQPAVAKEGARKGCVVSKTTAGWGTGNTAAGGCCRSVVNRWKTRWLDGTGTAIAGAGTASCSRIACILERRPAARLPGAATGAGAAARALAALTALGAAIAQFATDVRTSRSGSAAGGPLEIAAAAATASC